jgi:hypothetical protein
MLTRHGRQVARSNALTPSAGVLTPRKPFELPMRIIEQLQQKAARLEKELRISKQ